MTKEGGKREEWKRKRTGSLTLVVSTLFSRIFLPSYKSFDIFIPLNFTLLEILVACLVPAKSSVSTPKRVDSLGQFFLRWL